MADNEERIKIQFDTNADDTKKSVDSLNASIDVSVTENEKLAQTQSKVSKATQEQKAGFEDLGGGVGEAITQVKGLSAQFLKLLANPIILFLTAVVGALALLFKAFTSTNDGADKMERIFAGVSSVVDVLRDRFLQLFNALTSFDFKGIVDSFRGVGDEIAKEAQKAAELAGTLQEVEDATRRLGVSRAKLNRDLAEAKDLINDENASYAEKKKAIDLVKKAEGEQTSQELANAKRKYQAIKEQNALSDSSDEALQKEADALSAVYALQQKSAEDRRQIRRTEERADNEEKARIKAIQAERNRVLKERLRKEREAKKERDALRKKEQEEIEAALKAQKEAYEKNLNDIRAAIDKATEDNINRNLSESEREIRAVNDKYFALIEAAKQYGLDYSELLAAQKAEQAEINKKANDKEVEDNKKKAEEQAEIDKQIAEQKKAIQDAQLNAAASAVGFLKEIAGKNKTLQKAAIIAESALGIGKSVIANNTANIGALATPQAIATSGAAAAPVIAFNNISTGLGIAANIAATAKALQALGGGSAGSASTGAKISTVTGASAAPQTGFQASNENQIATSIASRQTEAPIVKAYVVSQDMTDQQKKDANLISQNSFGGK